MDRLASRFRCYFSVGDAIGNVIIWFILMIVTLGLAAFVFPYYVARAVINRTTILAQDGTEIGKLSCEISLGTVIGNAIIWVLLSIITLGLAYLVYIYRVYRVVLNETKIDYY